MFGVYHIMVMESCLGLSVMFQSSRAGGLAVWSCREQKEQYSYNCVHIAGVSLHASEAHPHGQLAVNSLRVQKVVLHVRADGLHLVEVLIPHKEGELHLAGLVEVDNHLCLGNARLVADDLLRQHLQAKEPVCVYGSALGLWSCLCCEQTSSCEKCLQGESLLHASNCFWRTPKLCYMQALTHSLTHSPTIRLTHALTHAVTQKSSITCAFAHPLAGSIP